MNKAQLETKNLAYMRCVRQLTAAMIIVMGLAVSCAPSLYAAPGTTAVKLPDPVTFSTQMELGDMKLATTWLDAGLSPDFLGSRIGSGLMIGAWEGNLELMRFFISRGAEIDLRNHNGESALALAAWRGKMDAVRWLLERGARINAPARSWSPLHYAVFGGHTAVAEYLLAQGADIDAQSTNGSSVLMMAVYEGHAELAKTLLARGARVDARNDWGDGALEWAMRNNRTDLARLVSDPETFQAAVNQPKEKWGTAQRSLTMSPELETLLGMRQQLSERALSTEAIDRRIAAERARIAREAFERPQLQRASSLEITAKRQQPNEQSVRIVGQEKAPRKGGAPVPPATFHGKAKMPIKGPVRNY